LTDDLSAQHRLAGKRRHDLRAATPLIFGGRPRGQPLGELDGVACVEIDQSRRIMAQPPLLVLLYADS